MYFPFQGPHIVSSWIIASFSCKINEKWTNWFIGTRLVMCRGYMAKYLPTVVAYIEIVLLNLNQHEYPHDQAWMHDFGPGWGNYRIVIVYRVQIH
jgi:hypothetical protein